MSGNETTCLVSVSYTHLDVYKRQVLAVINFLCYPGINRRSKDWMQKTEAAKTGTDSDTQIRTQFLKNLYEGFYLLDLEYQNQKSETEMSATDLYICLLYTSAEIKENVK